MVWLFLSNGGQAQWGLSRANGTSHWIGDAIHECYGAVVDVWMSIAACKGASLEDFLLAASWSSTMTFDSIVWTFTAWESLSAAD